MLVTDPKDAKFIIVNLQDLFFGLGFLRKKLKKKKKALKLLCNVLDV